MTSSHCETPDILNLSTHIKVNLSNKYTVTYSWKTRSSGSIRSSDIRAAIKVTKLFFRTFFIATCKYIWVNFSTNSVNVYCEVMVCNSSVSAFNWPKRFRKSIDSCSWIYNNLSSIETESHPMKRMMSSVTNVASNSSKLSVINWMSTFTFHVISWFIKISYSWNVTFFLFSQNISMVINVNWTVMKSLFILFSFKNWWNNDHVMFFGKLFHELNSFSFHWFGKLDPRITFSCTHEERCIENLL